MLFSTENPLFQCTYFISRNGVLGAQINISTVHPGQYTGVSWPCWPCYPLCTDMCSIVLNEVGYLYFLLLIVVNCLAVFHLFLAGKKSLFILN